MWVLNLVHISWKWEERLVFLQHFSSEGIKVLFKKLYKRKQRHPIGGFQCLCSKSVQPSCYLKTQKCRFLDRLVLSLFQKLRLGGKRRFLPKLHGPSVDCWAASNHWSPEVLPQPSSASSSCWGLRDEKMDQEKQGKSDWAPDVVPVMREEEYCQFPTTLIGWVSITGIVVMGAIFWDLMKNQRRVLFWGHFYK